MYKVIIVDDEQMIRNGIRSIIPWEKIGIDTVFTASSGQEALKIIEAENPEIMLTDISMAEMTGLELIEKVNIISPNMRIIVLTGYDSFEYVQKCCKMQVQDFILKPADEEELTGTIKNQVNELDKSKNVKHYQKIMSRVQGIAEQLKLEQAMRNLVHNRVKAFELRDIYEEYNYQENQQMQIAIIMPMLNTDLGWKGYTDLLNLSIKNICIGMFDSRFEGITFEDDDGKIIISIFISSSLDEVLERIEQLNNLLKDEYDISQKVMLGSVVNGFSEMSISYNDAMHLLSTSNENADDIVQSYHSELRLKMFNDTFQELKKIMTINIGDVDKLMKAYSTFEKSTQSYNLSNSFVRKVCFDIASAIYFSFINDTGESVDGKLTSLLNSLLVCNREEACKFTKTFIEQLLTQEEHNTHEIVSNAKNYIKDNIAEDLSVTEIAAQLYVTPNYFSRLFKKVTGEGCNEYIVRKRIEKAKSLLETTSIKTGIIASMVGYRDTNYFSLAFKRHTGVSPTAYRENIR